ncbi:MAG: hypothetical protein JW833_07835, partial [Prolixibacteraceae bacterium]|nr:hypothetical protein [Prolixibacteraceae bacterium]
MKLKVFSLMFSVMLICVAAEAQSPRSFNYQAVLRDASGQVLANQDVEIGIAILQGSTSGVEIFSEIHSETTNNFGLVNLEIGSVNQGGMETIDWGVGPYFVRISVNGTEMGTSQLLSVPFAMHAISVENDAVDDADSDPANEIQDISLDGHELSITEGSTVILPDQVDDADADPANEIQVISISNDTIYLSDGGYAIIPTGFDGSFTSLTNIPPNLDTDSTDDFDGQYSSLSGAPGNISEFTNDTGYITSPDDADSDPTNEFQVLSVRGDTIFLSDGGYAKLPSGFDGSFSSLTDVPPNLDTDVTDDFDGKYSSLSGVPENVSEFINDAGYITSPDDADADPTNEFQFLSVSNDTIYLTNGGFVKLPAGFDGSFTSLTNIPPNLDTDATDDFDGQYSSLAGVPENVSEFTNDAGYITNPDDADADP